MMLSIRRLVTRRLSTMKHENVSSSLSLCPPTELEGFKVDDCRADSQTNKPPNVRLQEERLHECKILVGDVRGSAMKNRSMAYSASDMPLDNTQQGNQETTINNTRNDPRLSLYPSSMLFSEEQSKSPQYPAFGGIVSTSSVWYRAMLDTERNVQLSETSQFSIIGGSDDTSSTWQDTRPDAERNLEPFEPPRYPAYGCIDSMTPFEPPQYPVHGCINTMNSFEQSLEPPQYPSYGCANITMPIWPDIAEDAERDRQQSQTPQFPAFSDLNNSSQPWQDTTMDTDSFQSSQYSTFNSLNKTSQLWHSNMQLDRDVVGLFS